MGDDNMNHLHPISFLCEQINGQLFVSGIPPLHLTVLIKDGLYIFRNVLDLPILLVERNRTES